VKKILSILVALGLVLGLVVMAAPASADVSTPQVTIPAGDNCACKKGDYTITFDVTGDLAEGGGSITIDFDDTTDLSTITAIEVTWDGFVSVAVPSAWITTDLANAVVTFYVPMHIVESVSATVTVVIKDITNPCVPGDYTLFVNTSAPVDATPVESDPYTIIPYYSSYKFVYDFSPTYPGIAEDFIPPFKACGQNCTDTDYNCVYNASMGAFFELFDLTLTNDGPPGCDTPCAGDAEIKVHLLSAPAGSTVTISFDGGTTYYTLTEPDDICTKIVFDTVALPAAVTITWPCLIHFDNVGVYEICFYAQCEAPECQEGGGEWYRCDPFVVWQWKDAYKIELYRKWNLISLPKVPLEETIEISDLLASYTLKDEIDSIWYYDHCLDVPTEDQKWFVWDGYAYQALTEVADGMGLWVLVDYSHTDPAKAPGLHHGTLWIWGTEKPVPPDSPSAYPVCDGWNMEGYTEIYSMMDDAYLWNFIPNFEYGAVYGWDPQNQVWDTPFSPTNVSMVPGKGYWISFNALLTSAAIYPP